MLVTATVRRNRLNGGLGSDRFEGLEETLNPQPYGFRVLGSRPGSYKEFRFIARVGFLQPTRFRF